MRIFLVSAAILAGGVSATSANELTEARSGNSESETAIKELTQKLQDKDEEVKTQKEQFEAMIADLQAENQALNDVNELAYECIATVSRDRLTLSAELSQPIATTTSDQTAENEELRLKVAELDKEKTSLLKTIQKGNEELAVYIDTQEELKETLAAKENEHVLNQEQLEKAVKQNQELAKQLEKTKELAKTLMSELQLARETAESTNADMTTLQEEVAKLKDEVKTAAADKAALGQQVDTANQSVATLEEEKLNLQNQVTDLNNQLQSNDDASTAQLEELRQKIAQVTDEATAKDAQLQAHVTLAGENAQMSLEDSQGQITHLQSQVDKLNANLQARDAEAKEAAADKAALESQVADLKSKLDDASPAAATTVTRKKQSKTPVGMIVGLVLVIVSVSGVGVYFWNLQTHISSAATNAV